MEDYNGFSGRERTANGAALLKAIRAGLIPLPSGPCSLCDDPGAKVEYHSENYATPYSWTAPAAYVVCMACHRNKLHKRFSDPVKWEAYKEHVRRGGYASDLKQPDVAREFKAHVAARRAGGAVELHQLRPYPHKFGSQWWEKLDSSAPAKGGVLVDGTTADITVLRQLETQLRALMRERAASFISVQELQLPTLQADSPPTIDRPGWFPVPGMYGGFKYWLESKEDPVRLLCDSWCRVVDGSEQRHEITVTGTRLVS